MTSSSQQPEHPVLSDRAVAALPLSAGRAELLEEIMSTPVLDHRDPASAARPRAQRWLVPAAAAALVVGLVGVPVWLAQDGGEGASGRTGGAAGDPTPAADSGYRAVLGAGGWQPSHVTDEGRAGGEVSYTNGDKWVDLYWRPADTHPGYVDDRSEGGAQPGEPIELLGLPALLWAYSATDHTVIREPDLGFLLEVRGAGMGKAAFLELLAHVRLVDEDGFEAAMPDSYIGDAEREGEVQAMLDGIAETTTPLFPEGTVAAVDSTQPDRYQLGADVSGAVACAWLDEFVEAKAAGDARRVDAATDALVGAREWPILLEMDAEGAWSDVLWGYVDQVAEGEVPEGYEDGLGCVS